MMSLRFLSQGTFSAAALLAALTLAGCAHPSASQGDAKHAAFPHADYRCDDGTTFSVAFDQRQDLALVTLDGNVIGLESQRPASGMWYASTDYEFRGKGNEATWTAGSAEPIQCRIR